MDSFGREDARSAWGMERESGCAVAASGGTMGWHCSRTPWPSWMGTGWSIEVLDMVADGDARAGDEATLGGLRWLLGEETR